jgi:hypothetical protein
MKDQLGQLEKRLQGLVEVSLARMAGGRIAPAAIANQLATGMTDGLTWDADGRAYAPDEYVITLHPKDVEALIDQVPDLSSDFSQALLEAARSSGYAMASPPHVTLAADPTLGRWEVRVVAWHSGSHLEFTKAGEAAVEPDPASLPKGAYLILHGQRHFALDRPLVNVGRRLDNQLILDDPRVSRTHAQLRAREGRFVIFDLGSTGGTFINGRKVHQHILRPGDVITIAGVMMVYGEDPGGPPDSTPAYTPPFPPRPAGDQMTGTWGDEELTES